ncbi:MAG: hypothetical protein LUO85_05155, partial [Methanomassiliicoccales archaeon]|nr:hypothetical protein [Methanomassiliicoccales archaeon]
MLVMAVMIALPSGVVATSSNPVISTDKADYSPGETVIINGSGFVPNLLYDVAIIRPDGSIVKGDGTFTSGWDAVPADASGNFTYNYRLDGVVGTYEIKVYDSPWSGDIVAIPLTTATFTDAGDWSTTLRGWDIVANAWSNGNLAGYHEGDLVGFKFALTNNQATSAASPAIDSTYDYYNRVANALGLDDEVSWSYGFADFSTQFPSGFTPVVPNIDNAFYQYSGNTVENYHEFSAGTWTIASGATLYIYFQVHLAETSYWQTVLTTIPNDGANNGPHFGSHYWNGASMQVGLALQYTGQSTQSQQIATPLLASGMISGEKFNDLDGDGAPREAGEPGLGGWTIVLNGTDTVGHQFNETTTTLANGSYSFPSLPLGTYNISEVLQPGWTQTYPSFIRYIGINLTAGDRNETGVNFGNVRPKPSVTTLLSSSNITLGQSVTDTVTVQGFGGSNP